MSTTDPRTAGTTRTASTANEVRQRPEQPVEFYRPRTSEARETKPSIMTSELWLTIAGVVLLIVAYNVADEGSLNLFRLCLLATVLGAAYIVSRGLAKSGSHDIHDDDARRSYRP